MTRVLMIGLTSPLEGGAERHVYEVSSRIKRCTVATQKGSLCKRKIELPTLGGPILLRNIFFMLVSMIFAIYLVVRLKKKYDVVHMHPNLLYFLAPVLRLRYHVVITVHGMKGFKFYDNKFLWFFFKLGLKAADRIIAVSLSDKALIEKELKNVVYVPNGVDLSIYKSRKTKVLIDKKITFIGRIHEQKGIIYLLEAFERIKEKYPDYTLEIIGEINDYAKELQQKFNDKRIIWRGFIREREEIARSLKNAFCIALPSLWEGLPLTLFEALASSRPVIVSDIQSFKDVVDDEVIFSKAGDSADLAEKLEEILDNIPKSAEMGELGSKKAAKYDWKQIAKKIENIYSKI